MITFRFLCVLFFTLTLSGCLDSIIKNKNPTYFYALNTLAENEQNTPTEKNNRFSGTLGLGPVLVPRLLKHPQLVTRENKHQIHLHEFHQWGGSLQEEIAQTLANNLEILLKSDPIQLHPWRKSYTPDYQIELNIERLDGTLGGTVVLQCQWRIIAQSSKTARPLNTSKISVESQGEDYTDYVAAQSQAVYELAQKIKNVVSRL